MKFKTPILYDKNGTAIAWLEQEIPAEKIAELRWGFAHAIKDCKEKFTTPIVDDEEDTVNSYFEFMKED
jgi:hypothetical protein